MSDIQQNRSLSDDFFFQQIQQLTKIINDITKKALLKPSDTEFNI